MNDQGLVLGRLVSIDPTEYLHSFSCSFQIIYPYQSHCCDKGYSLHFSFCDKITKDVVTLVVQKLWGSLGPGGTDSEYLQRWCLKSGGDRNNCTSVEICFYWIANGSPLWAVYCEFISVCIIEIEKQPGIHPVGVG